jgi:hypothetical protein
MEQPRGGEVALSAPQRSGASRTRVDEIARLRSGSGVIRITAARVDGKGNVALCRFPRGA